MTDSTHPQEQLAEFLALCFTGDPKEKLPHGHPVTGSAHNRLSLKQHFLSKIAQFCPIDWDALTISVIHIAYEAEIYPNIPDPCKFIVQVWGKIDTRRREQCLIAFLAVSNIASTRRSALLNTYTMLKGVSHD